MDSRAIDRVKHALNTDVIRKLLIKYFREKGYSESFNRLLYPAQLQDLTTRLPLLDAKLEVVPHAVELDPLAGKAVLGWNLFVLGNHRMYLEETHHYDLANLARQIQQGQVTMQEEGLGVARKMCTPRQVIQFVTRVLERHESGYVDLNPPQRPVTALGQAAGYRNLGRQSGFR